uniref:Uncharacterized protein n=1 Tax=Oryza barthii TaxID=65489 RepID=A0A0D3FTY9_9ORYZ
MPEVPDIQGQKKREYWIHWCTTKISLPFVNWMETMKTAKRNAWQGGAQKNPAAKEMPGNLSVNQSKDKNRGILSNKKKRLGRGLKGMVPARELQRGQHQEPSFWTSEWRRGVERGGAIMAGALLLPRRFACATVAEGRRNL